jgi:catechol 2,3-dioxygenase-like lactoylglutathione lyase family enzyme
MIMPTEKVNVRYIVDDVDAAVAWYTMHLGFKLLSKHAPAFAAGRPLPHGEQPKSGGWNRIVLVVEDLPAEVARLRAAGVRFRNDIVTGLGGSQILLIDPAGNFVELFQAG